MVLWESQDKTWEMFITAVNRNPYAHSVCCCYIYNFLTYMMKSDKLPLTQDFNSVRISHTFYWGKWEKRVNRTGVGELSHKLHFFPTLWALKPWRSDPVPKLIQLLQRVTPSFTKCSLQRLSKSLHESNLPWTLHRREFIYKVLFVDLKSNLPGTAIQYFHCNCYIFLNLCASFKIKWNWNKWLCQLHNS